MFQSPLGEVVKETKVAGVNQGDITDVSIPSRGSCKGDLLQQANQQHLFDVSIPSRGSCKGDHAYDQISGELSGENVFQSPLGEVVKETTILEQAGKSSSDVSSPSRGSGKGDFLLEVTDL